MRRRSLAPLPVLCAALLACRSDGPAALAAECRAAPPVLSLAPLRGAVVRPAETGSCARLAGPGARYLVVAQFAAQGSGTARATFALTAAGAAARPVLAGAPGPARGAGGESPRMAAPFMAAPLGANRVQHEFDRTLRQQERTIPAEREVASGRARLSRAGSGAAGAAGAVALDSVRDFRLLKALTGKEFTTVRATRRYTGEHVAVYVDQAAPTAGGFTDEALQRFAAVFDETLYPIGAAAFGSPSDIDNNGRVLVVITPRVNALTERSRCRSDGFVTGYFYGVDLAPRQTGSNKGEVFYVLAPDPTGTVSCPHSAAQIEQLAAPVFVHELQHMISYNHHKLARGGQDEAVWLNEGLSHIAEELASLHYERRYPAPQQRSNPAQLFPDSSQAFLVPNLVNAYNYLAASRDHSVTSFRDFGTLAERGAAWLFLRWLADQAGDDVFKRLVQTTRTGTENVSAVAGRPFTDLFADFGVAVWADSLPGVAREAVPARYRFALRNLRETFGRLSATGTVGGPFPLELTSVAGGAALSRDMRTGTLDFFEVRVPAESASVLLRFAPGAGDVGFRSPLGAQLAVLRLPE